MKITGLGFWIKTACLFLIRSGRSTAVLSLMVMTAVAVLVFLSSLAVGVNDAMVKNSVSLYSGHISGFNLPQSLDKKDLLQPGVAGVLKRFVATGVLTKASDMETVMLASVDPDAELRHTALWKKTISGAYPSADTASVYISSVVADGLGVKPGGELSFVSAPGAQPVRLVVSGVFKTGVPHLDRLAIAPSGAVPVDAAKWHSAVFLDDGIDPADVISGYRERLTDFAGLDFKAWGDLMPDLRQLIELNYVSMGIVIVLVFAVVSVGIASAFSIFIFKHLREYGIMKAMGVTSFETTALITAEVAVMNSAASLAGALLGVAAVFITAKAGGIDLTAFTSHNQYFAVSGVIMPRLTVYSLLAPPAVCFAFGVLSAVWPAVLIIRAKAADILRTV